MTKLKTCPFCGAEAEEILGSSCWKIRCTVCKAEITGIDRRTNINNWNRRIEPSKKVVAQIKVDIDELIERIKEEYEITEKPVCEDAISRQAAIDAVEKAVFKDVAKSAIKSLPPVEPKQPKGEWIPVSERLPEGDDDVLVTVWWGYGKPEVWAIDYAGVVRGIEVGQDADEKILAHILAWQPLPAPYKDDDNG